MKVPFFFCFSVPHFCPFYFESRYKCVSWEKSTRKWKAVLRVHGKTKTIGRYTNELDAGTLISFLLT